MSIEKNLRELQYYFTKNLFIDRYHLIISIHFFYK